MHAAVQSGTNARSQSPKNQPSSSRQTSLVAKNKKSAYGTLHTTEHQIQVNIKVIYPKYTMRQSFPEPSGFQYSERTIASTETNDTPAKSP